MMVRIYLYYDIEDYPYKVIPMFLVIKGVFPKDFKHVIVDSGVNRYFKYMRLKEYPEWYLKVYPKVAVRLTKEYGNAVWITIPDYPDDYEQNRMPNNTERTLANIVRFISEYPDVNWLPVVQARWMNVPAFRDALMKYTEVLREYPRVAIGTLCTRGTLDYAVATTALTRKYFPNAWIHVFGPNIKWLRRIKYYVNSIDSVAYHKPPHGIRGKGATSRYEYAMEWLRTAVRYCGNECEWGKSRY
jgi:hypothetical protein